MFLARWKDEESQERLGQVRRRGRQVWSWSRSIDAITARPENTTWRETGDRSTDSSALHRDTSTSQGSLLGGLFLFGRNRRSSRPMHAASNDGDENKNEVLLCIWPLLTCRVRWHACLARYRATLAHVPVSKKYCCAPQNFAFSSMSHAPTPCRTAADDALLVRIAISALHASTGLAPPRRCASESLRQLGDWCKTLCYLIGRCEISRAAG